jgi:hypothetical protein
LPPNWKFSEPLMFRSIGRKPLLPPIVVIGLAVLIGFDAAMASRAWKAWKAPLTMDTPANRSSLPIPQLPAGDRVLVRRHRLGETTILALAATVPTAPSSRGAGRDRTDPATSSRS